MSQKSLTREQLPVAIKTAAPGATLYVTNQIVRALAIQAVEPGRLDRPDLEFVVGEPPRQQPESVEDRVETDIRLLQELEPLPKANPRIFTVQKAEVELGVFMIEMAQRLELTAAEIFMVLSHEITTTAAILVRAERMENDEQSTGYVQQPD